MGYDGMYSYLTKGLGFSDGAAYRRLQSARLLKQLPEVAKKVEDGALNLSQLTQVQKCLKEVSQKDHSVHLEITLSAEQFAELETAKSLLSHICVDGKWPDIIATLAEKYNKKKLGGHTLKIAR